MTPSTAGAGGYPVTELAQAIDAELRGPTDLRVTGVNSLEQATAGHLVLLAGHRLLEKAKHSQASAFIVSQYYPELDGAQLISAQPQFDFVRLITRFFSNEPPPTGIAREVVQGTDVQLGVDVFIGPFVTIGHHAKIGDRVRLYPGVCVGDDVTIGDETVLHPHVSVGDGCRIGARVIVHAGTVIGSDGFGYVQHEGRHHKIPQRGIVVIDDDVEIGANVTVDRATFGRTHIKQGTKIDNQVQIAHNVTIGEQSIIVAQVGIAGSTSIGQHVMIGGQAGLIEHLTVGDRARIAAGAGIQKNVGSGVTMSGRPAKRREVFLRAQALLYRLPDLSQQVSKLKKRLAAMEDRTEKTRTRKTGESKK